MQKKQNINTNFRKLIDSFSYKQVSNIFYNIDKKLVLLQNHSSKDFICLNKDFKKLYNNSKNISNEIDIIGQLIKKHISDREKELAKFSQFKKHLNNVCNNTRLELNYKNSNFIKIQNNFNSFFFNNLSNDINKDSIANIKSAFVALSKKYESIINSLNEVCLNNDSIYKLINTNRSKYFNCSNLKFDSQILDIKDKIDDSFSQVVKCLQYQDIISQKMVHIQDTHTNLHRETEKIYNSTSNLINEKVKLFISIKDIAGLQAAQLIQINNEYKYAVETIKNNFSKASDLSLSYVNIAKKIINKDLPEKEKIFSENINNIYNNKLFISTCETINYVNTEVNKFIIMYNNLLVSIENAIETSNEKEIKNKEFIENLLPLINDLKENKSKIIKQFETVYNLKNDIEDYRINQKNKFTDYNFFIEKWKIKINNCNLLTNNVINDTTLIFNDIKFYKEFKTEFAKLINELNSINYNLKIQYGDNINSKETNLAYIKKYYTMDSEHIIHDKLINSDNSELEIDNDNEIEFF